MGFEPCNQYIIYRHITPNDKSYIGITKNSTSERWRRDGRGYCRQMFYNAVLKYGWENIRHEILDYATSLEEANQKEKLYIAYYKSNDSQFGYNLTSGGDGTPGHVVLDEQRAKIIENNKRMWQDPILSEQMRQHISETMRTDEMRHLHREVLNKLRSSDEFQKKRIAAMPRGKDHYGSRQVYCVETGKRYVSSIEASVDTGIPASEIRMCATGQQFTTHGLHWCDVDGLTDDEISLIVLQKDTTQHYKGVANGVCVCCVETGVIYQSYIEAARSCGLVNGDRIGISCRKPLNTAGGYHWMHIDRQWDETRRMKELSLRRDKLNQLGCNISSRSVANSGLIGSEYDTGRHNAANEDITLNGVTYLIPQNAKPVCCVETGQVFISIREACEQTGATLSGIIASCREPHRTSGDLHWVYVVVDPTCDFDQFLQKRRVEITNTQYIDPKCKRVMCVETQQVFDSIKDAACAVGTNRSHVGACCRGTRKTAGGYHWRFIDYMDGDFI